MKVNLIDYTGSQSSDPLYAARLLIYTKNTRLTQGEETRQLVAEISKEDVEDHLKAIAKTIRSSWEFVDYTFEIQGVTRAFTHQLVRTRTASYAQQAQRVVDMSGFETLVPDSVRIYDAGHEWKSLMEHVDEVYRFYYDSGIPAQDARGILPTNVLTNIITKMNLRTLADLCAKRLNLRAQDEYQGVVASMKELVLGVQPWTKDFLEPERTSTPALDAILKEALGEASPVDMPSVNAALKELDLLKGTWG